MNRLLVTRHARQKTRLLSILVLVMTTLLPLSVFADEADVVNVTIESLGDGKFRINATVAHADTGWDHYANRWDVLDETGQVIGVRELAHPHENEQPFTRSVRVDIPLTVKRITVRANDSVHDTGGKLFEIDVPHP